MPATRFRKVQTGLETVWGTAVAATARRMGVTNVSFTPVPVVELAEELGQLNPSGLANLSAFSTKGVIAGWAAYEDWPYSLDALFGVATPGAGPGYKRDWAGPTIAAPAPRLNTFEFNQPSYAYICAGNIMTTYQLVIESGQMWKYTENYLGKSMVPGSLTSLASRAIEAILAKDTVVTVDAFGGTIGTTGFPATAFKVTLNVNSRRHLKPFIGSALPQDWGFDQYQGTLKLECELNASSKALLDVIANASPSTLQRLFQFKATSPATGHIALVNFAGVLLNPDDLFGDRGGNEVLALNFAGNTDIAGFGNWIGASDTNGIATLP